MAGPYLTFGSPFPLRRHGHADVQRPRLPLDDVTPGVVCQDCLWGLWGGGPTPVQKVLLLIAPPRSRPPRDALEGGEVPPPPTSPGRPAYAQPLSP